MPCVVLSFNKRLKLWEDGDIEELLREASVLQNRMPARKVKKREVAEVARLFAGHVFRGDSRAALQLVDEQEGGLLEFSPEVIAAAKAIHPPAQPAEDSALLNPLLGPPPEVIFDEIDGCAIKEAALRTKGGAGPSAGMPSTGNDSFLP